MEIYDWGQVQAVLAGLIYPVRTWQLYAQADAYGADAHTREALSRLPVRTYPSLDAVLTELHATRPKTPAIEVPWWEPRVGDSCGCEEARNRIWG